MNEFAWKIQVRRNRRAKSRTRRPRSAPSSARHLAARKCRAPCSSTWNRRWWTRCALEPTASCSIRTSWSRARRTRPTITPADTTPSAAKLPTSSPIASAAWPRTVSDFRFCSWKKFAIIKSHRGDLHIRLNVQLMRSSTDRVSWCSTRSAADPDPVSLRCWWSDCLSITAKRANCNSASIRHLRYSTCVKFIPHNFCASCAERNGQVTWSPSANQMKTNKICQITRAWSFTNHKASLQLNFPI